MGATNDRLYGLRNLVSISLMGFDNGNGTVSLVDRDAKVFAIIRRDACDAPSLKSVVAAGWKLKAHRMASQVRAARKEKSEWEKKCETWTKCLRSRAFDQWRNRKAQRQRFFSELSRPDWASAAVRWKFQLKNRIHRKAMHDQSPWRLWAETCSKNHNRKERARAGKSERAIGHGRRTELQMQFKSRRAFASNV